MEKDTVNTMLGALEFAPAFLTGDLPGVDWQYHDDLCDCTFQRIGFWTNPYLGRTLKYRFCCIWAEFSKMFPQFVQEIPSYYDGNSAQYVDGVAEWNGEDDMPRAIWYRHLAQKTGKTLAEIRVDYADAEPPKGVKRQRPYNGPALTISA